MSEQNVDSSHPFEGIFSNPSPAKISAPSLITIPPENEVKTPLVNHLESLLPQETLRNTGVTTSLASLREMEAQFLAMQAIEQQRLEAKKMSDQILDSFQNSKNHKRAKRIVESINYNLGYMVDLMFDPQNRLISANIDIRTNLKQDRHVTPVLVVKQIILNALRINKKLEKVFCSLQSKIEIFKFFLNTKDNAFIQHIFEFFKNPIYQTPSGISLLIKIIAHFYNTKGYLIMDDKCVAIPYNVNNVYMIPSLRFGGEKRTHKAEGTFIEAALKFVKGINELVDKNKNATKLKATEIAQVIYNIFSVFDYLPLPETVISSADPSKEKTPTNPSRNRYSGESIDRLYQVAANHLHFVFEAYPALSAFYKIEILQGFLKHLAFGIDPEDLCGVLGVDSVFSIQSKIEMDEENILQNFTNKGKIQGFYRQYCDPKKTSKDEFYNHLSENTKKILCDLSADYFLELDPELEKSVEKEIRNKNRENYLESLSIKYFNWLLHHNLDEFFDIMAGEKICPVPISTYKFGDEFLQRMNTVIQSQKDKYTVEFNKPVDKANFKRVMKQLTETSEHQLISEAIKASYLIARKDSPIELTRETLNTLKTHVLSLESPKKGDSKHEDMSIDYSEFITKFHNQDSFLSDEESIDYNFINASDRSASFSYSSTENSTNNSPIKLKDKELHTETSAENSPYFFSPITPNPLKRSLDSEALAQRLNRKTKMHRGPLFSDNTINNIDTAADTPISLANSGETPMSLVESGETAMILVESRETLVSQVIDSLVDTDGDTIIMNSPRGVI